MNKIATAALNFYEKSEQYQYLLSRVGIDKSNIQRIGDCVDREQIKLISPSETVIVAVFLYAFDWSSVADEICPKFFSLFQTCGYEPIFDILSFN